MKTPSIKTPLKLISWKSATAVVVLIASFVLRPVPVEAQLSFTNLHSFSVFPNGANPSAPLVQGADGNFYGTTYGGGTSGGSYGTIYKVTPGGVETVLYQFTNGVDSSHPQAGLVQAGDFNLYGVMPNGGSNGYGYVFKISTNGGGLTVLYSFAGGEDGSNPQFGLTLGSDGNLYGTTQYGGNYGIGNIFGITTSGALTNLYSFYFGTGEEPQGGLVLGSDGNLYGTTEYGGDYYEGTIFKFGTNGILTTAYSFFDDLDYGYHPTTGLVQGSNGVFYGSTLYGGTNFAGNIFEFTVTRVVSTNSTTYSYAITNLCSFATNNSLPSTTLALGTNGGLYWTSQFGGRGLEYLDDDEYIGNGAIFELTTNGTVTNYYSFTGNADGAYPQAALVRGSDGNLYGTASSGGVGYSYGGNGTVFKISNGTVAPIYAFAGLNDGQEASALVHGSGGSFYATTQTGGTNGGNGSVFSLTPAGTFASLYSFYGSYDGENPQSALLQCSDGNFYGTTEYLGSTNYDGTVFKISPSGALTTLYAFTNYYVDGAYPNSALVEGADGELYGTAQGGSYGTGNIFKVTTNGTLTTVYSFTGGADGDSPSGLVLGNNGKLYGISQGGSYFLVTSNITTNSTNYYTNQFTAYGTVFAISSDGSFDTIYYFTNGVDGANPSAPLVLGVDGNFYGSTTQGAGYGNGGLFQVTPQGSLTPFYAFTGDIDGSNPSTLLAGANGAFYGTTYTGGTNHSGSVFEVIPQMTTNALTATFTNLYSFSGGVNDGGYPNTSLVQGSDGSLYGTTTSGGVGGYGGIFHLSGAGLPSPLPVITQQPASVSNVLAGLSASFSVTAIGGAPLNYQWQSNGVSLPMGAEFSGTILPNLTVDPAFQSDAVSYSVIVANSYGAVTSAPVSLSVYAATNATEAFTEGTNFLAQADLIAANLSFSNAIYLNSANTNAAANDTNYLYLAATELLSLPYEPAGSNFLNYLGVGTAGRDVFKWKAKLAHKIPVGVNGDDFTAQLRTNVLSAIIAAQADLAQIVNTNFTAVLSTNETHAGAVTVDYGDVQVMRSMCEAAELFIYTTYSWNLNVQLTTVSNLLEQDKSFQLLLADYPSLLTTTSTSDIPAASNAFVSGTSQYFAGSQFIRSRPTNDIEPPYVFNLRGANAMTNELKFRETLSNLLASLNTTNLVPLTAYSNYSISASAFFSGHFNPRAYFPSFQSNDFVWNSFPDPTFGGVFGGLTEQTIGNAFLKHLKHVDARLDVPSVSVTVLYSFPSFMEQNGVVQGPDGSLYGTTQDSPFTSSISYSTNTFPGDDGIVITNITSYTNENANDGTFFKISPSGQYSTLFTFGTVQGTTIVPYMSATPNALTLGADGNFYGTTQSGGITYLTNINGNNVNLSIDTNAGGTVFKMTPSGQMTLLYSFYQQGDQYASKPSAALVQGVDGTFYGTTELGGTNGEGTVFQITPSGQFSNLASFSSQTTNVTYSFIITEGVYDTNIGAIVYTNSMAYGSSIYPLSGGYPSTPLVQGTDGSLYGTTPFGGFFTNIVTNNFISYYYSYDTNLSNYVKVPVSTNALVTTNYGYGSGTIFKVTPSGQLTTLYIFGTEHDTNGNPLDGSSPGGLVLGVDGDLYGTTQSGGSNFVGTAFKISPSGVFTLLLTFDQNGFDGNSPFGPLVLGANGALYGVGSAGGANNSGSVFLVNTNNPAQTNITWFDSSSGSYGNNFYDSPTPSPLALGSDGSYYGTTTDDGGYGNGTVYRLTVSNVAPTIVSQPGSRTNLAGSTVSFQVSAYGSPAPSYSWLLNGRPLFNAGGVSGAQSSVLTLTNITSISAGAYSVMVSNAFGVATSSNAVLTVLLPPSITTEPVNQLAAVGAAATFTVSAAGTPALLYQWQFNGANIAGATNAAYTIADVAATNTGSYLVVVKNPYGSVTSSVAVLAVQEANIAHDSIIAAITSPTSSGRTTTGVSGTATDTKLPIWNVFYWVTNLSNGKTVTSGQAVLTSGLNGATNWSVTNILPGTNIIAVQAVDFASNVSKVVTREFFYDTASALNLTTSGTGSGSFSIKSTVAGEARTNAAALNIGETYTITALATTGSLFSGWTVITTNSSYTTNVATVKFVMGTGLSLIADFETNIYLGSFGTYNGLFAAVNSNGIVDVTEATAGLLSGLVVGTNGKYSGKLYLDGTSKPITGVFNTYNDGTNTYGSITNKVAFTGGNVSVEMTLDASTNPPYIYGVVSGTNGGGWSSVLMAFRASKTVPAADYTMLIPPASSGTPAGSPGGYGYASITNTAGSAKTANTTTISGALADGTSISQTVAVSDDGYVPIYDSLYANKGLLLGWINLENTNAEGVGLTWIHPTTKTGLYTGGFTVSNTPVEISPWSGTTAALTAVTNALTNLFITDAITNPVGLSFGVVYGKTFTLKQAGGGKDVSGSLNPKTGLFKVTFGSGSGKTTNGFGAILQGATNGGGYFLSPTTGGAIQLQP